MEDIPHTDDPFVTLVLVGGFTFIAVCLLIVFGMFVYGMKRNANIQRVKKWFWNEPRPNGQHKKREAWSRT